MPLEAKNVSFRYTAKTPPILSSVSFAVAEGERVGVVAPSGYGKTTLVKILAGYEHPTEGQVLLDGAPLMPKGAGGSAKQKNNRGASPPKAPPQEGSPTDHAAQTARATRRAQGALPVQLVGQHPEYAINPRWKMRKVLQEAGQLRDEVLHAMGIEPEWLNRYPRELSGGELQRFCVARALGAETRFLIADEMSTMLDVISQAQIWQYLLAEAGQRGLGLVVVTHNPALAKRVCTRVVDLRDINHIPLPLEGIA